MNVRHFYVNLSKKDVSLKKPDRLNNLFKAMNEWIEDNNIMPCFVEQSLDNGDLLITVWYEEQFGVGIKSIGD